MMFSGNKHTQVMRYQTINVIGLGYVGITLALTLADLGFKVRGFDVNKKLIENLQKNKTGVLEKGLEELMGRHNNKNFKALEIFTRTPEKNQVFFITVGTPLDEKNLKPKLDYIKSAALLVGKTLRRGDLVILRSTVPLGTSREIVLPILEEKSGFGGGRDFYLAFAPERTVEGKALEELRTLPQVIGGLNQESTDAAKLIFDKMTKLSVLLDSLEEAELVKLVNNTYRNVVFSFANELSLFCHHWGLNTKKVIEAANSGYERSRVPMPAPGVGGPCLQKDLRIFVESGKAKGYEPAVASRAFHTTAKTISFIANEVKNFLKAIGKDSKRSKVFVLGFAFKGIPETSDTRGSTTLDLIKALKKFSKNIDGYDPKVSASEIKSLGVRPLSNPADGFNNADAVIFMNNHPKLQELNLVSLLQTANNPVFVFDAWGLHEETNLNQKSSQNTPEIKLANAEFLPTPRRSNKNIVYKKL